MIFISADMTRTQIRIDRYVSIYKFSDFLRSLIWIMCARPETIAKYNSTIICHFIFSWRWHWQVKTIKEISRKSDDTISIGMLPMPTMVTLQHFSRYVINVFKYIHLVSRHQSDMINSSSSDRIWTFLIIFYVLENTPIISRFPLVLSMICHAEHDDIWEISFRIWPKSFLSTPNHHQKQWRWQTKKTSMKSFPDLNHVRKKIRYIQWWNTPRAIALLVWIHKRWCFHCDLNASIQISFDQKKYLHNV